VIFIEFAIAIPVLMAIFYYLHDVPKYKRMQSRMEFCASCMANILQNMSQNRIDKRITLADFGYAVQMAFMSIYPGKTMYEVSERVHEYGHFPMTSISCIRGRDNGNIDILWKKIVYVEKVSPLYFTGHSSRSSIPAPGLNINSNLIFPGFSINSGQMKIVLECAIFFQNDYYYSFPNRSCDGVSTREAFGFCVFAPEVGYGTVNAKTHFNTLVIFTPKPGLFGDNVLK
jgi:hypothetical protein